MGISVLQPSFGSGELSPNLYARVDLARYTIGLSICKNFMIMAGGGARNRPGTRLVDSTKTDQAARLVRFKFSSNDSCVLVFTNLLMRVVRNGAYVLNSTGPSVGLPFELVTPWTIADLKTINWTQSADVMTFVHTSYRPRDIKRFANDNWTITENTYVPQIGTPASATATAPAGTGSTKTVSYQVTAVRDDTVQLEESLPVSSNAITVFSSNPNPTLTWSAVAGATYYNVYKDDTGSFVYGFIGRAYGTSTFTDQNILATKTDTPPTGLDPFVGAGNYPGAVGFYQQRKVYGGTLNRPQTSWFSRSGVFNNFGYSTPIKDDDAITWTMASTEVNQILNYLPLRQLVTLTSGAEWSIEGGTAGFTAKTINGNPQSYNGSSYLPPLVLNDTAIYMLNGNQSVAGLNYSLEADGLSSEDVMLWSDHLLRDFTIIDWAYQKRRDSIVWAVRSDGTLIAMTYLRKQDVIAWHRHETDGYVESVCCVPEGTEDAVYLVVRRTIGGVDKRFIERLQTREIPVISLTRTRDVAQAYFVDCGLSYQGWQSTNSVRRLTGGVTWLSGESITLLSAIPEFVVGDIGKVFAMRDPVTLDVLYLDVISFATTGAVGVKPRSIVPAGLRDIAVPYFGRAVKTVSGIGHLEGKGVAILADGNVVGTTSGTGNLVVTGGAITLPNPAVVVHVGLPYTSDLQTLRINVSGQETLNDKHKIVTSVSVIANESRGIFAGSDVDHLFEFKQRQYENYNSPDNLLSDMAKISITNDWDGQGQVFIRQQDPLPLTILGIIPELTIAGKN